MLPGTASGASLGKTKNIARIEILVNNNNNIIIIIIIITF